MNKKLLALAVAGAFVAPVAMAETSVYGVAGMSVDVVNDGAASSTSTNRLSSNQSRIGVKASEDLGGGLSVVAQMEGSVAMDAGTGPTFDRNTYLGLKSNDMGTLILGHYDTPYKISTRRLDVFADTIADNRSGGNVDGKFRGAATSGLLSGHDTRLNVAAYVSPAMNGFTVAVAGAFGAEDATSTSTKGSAISLAGMYEQGPVYAALGYQNKKFGSAGSGDLAAPTGSAVDDESKAIKLGVGYTMDAITVNAVVEQLTDRVAIGGVESKGSNLYLGGKFAVSSADAVKLAYTKRGEKPSGGANKATQFALGYDHNMSKNTSVYALYSKKTEDAAPDPSVISLGVKHAF